MEKLSIFVDLSKGECSKKFVFDLHDFSGFVVKYLCDHLYFRYGEYLCACSISNPSLTKFIEACFLSKMVVAGTAF